MLSGFLARHDFPLGDMQTVMLYVCHVCLRRILSLRFQEEMGRGKNHANLEDFQAWGVRGGGVCSGDLSCFAPLFNSSPLFMLSLLCSVLLEVWGSSLEHYVRLRELKMYLGWG